MTKSILSEASEPASQGLSDELYRQLIVIDGKAFLHHSNRYVGNGANLTEAFLTDIRASGLTAISTTVGGSRTLEETKAFIEGTDEAIASRPDAVIKLVKAADIQRCKQSGNLGVLYDLQGTHELDGEIDRVRVLAEYGVRVFQLTYNKAALVGDGCLEGRNAGLSGFGHEVIAAIEAQHCLLDLSHAGRRTTAEAIAASKRPCAITHAGCSAITPHPRNVDDSAIRAIAEKGGIFGVYFMTYLRKKGQSVREDVIAHVEHAIDMAGEDHVTIGTDGNIGPLLLTDEFLEYWRVDVCESRRRAGIAAPNEGPDIFNYVPEYNTPNRLQTFGGDLIRRGHSLTRVKKLLGENLLRVYGEVLG